MLVILLNLGNFEYVDFSLCFIYVLGSPTPPPPSSPPPPPSPHDQFLPHSKPTFWVSMGMNSQSPLPGVSAPPIKPLDTTVSLLLYPLVTRGHPPHCGEIQPAYARHGDPYPHPRLPPTPVMRPSASMAES